jgi:hypothetical protein
MSCFLRLSFLHFFKIYTAVFFSFFFPLLCLHCLLVLNLQLSIPRSNISLLKFLRHDCVFSAWGIYNKLTAGMWYLSIHPYVFQLWKNWVYFSEINFFIPISHIVRQMWFLLHEPEFRLRQFSSSTSIYRKPYILNYAYDNDLLHLFEHFSKRLIFKKMEWREYVPFRNMHVCLY